MFTFFKTTERIEQELRAWAVENWVHTQGESERHEGEEYFNEMDVRQVAEIVGSTAYSAIEHAKMMRSLTGQGGPSLREQWSFAEGVKLVQGLAKRKGWKARVIGSAASGYQCQIS